MSKNIIETDKLPTHVGIIMDGNGRWATKRGLPRMSGHIEGGKTFRKIVRHCKDIGIKYVTFYAFSTENWKRSEEEVGGLMKLFKQHIDETKEYKKNKTRVLFLGDKSPFDDELRNKMLELEEKSAEFDEFTLMMAMNYGGRADITNAAKRAALMLKQKEIKAEDIDEDLLQSLLYTGGAPDVDLLIRTSGEKRLSNFLLWQSAYAELYFTDTLWPDFTAKELDRILEDFQNRDRRFGNA